MKERAPADYFETYLKTKSSYASSEQAAIPADELDVQFEEEGAQGGGGVEANTVVNPFGLLRILLLEGGPLEVGELQRRSGMDFADFGETLSALIKGDLLEVIGQPGEQAARLTAHGTVVAPLAS